MADGVSYLEIRFSPILHTRENLNLSTVMHAICEGKAMAEYNLPIQIRIIVCGMRQMDAQVRGLLRTCPHPAWSSSFRRTWPKSLGATPSKALLASIWQGQRRCAADHHHLHTATPRRLLAFIHSYSFTVLILGLLFEEPPRGLRHRAQQLPQLYAAFRRGRRLGVHPGLDPFLRRPPVREC